MAGQKSGGLTCWFWSAAILLVASGASAESTCNIPESLADSIRLVAEQVIGEEADLVAAGQSRQNASAGALRQQLALEIDRLGAEAYVAALSLDVEERIKETSAAIGQAGEVARMDKQVGAASGSSGTTTLSERSALPLLLGMAVEHGAIDQKTNGTTLTLSTSAYGLMVLGNEDNDTFYQENSFARMWGVSANFLLDEGATGLNGLDEADLTSVTAKFTFGDRSTRSKKFQAKWREKAQPFFQEKVNRQRALLKRLVPRTDSNIRARTQEMMAPNQENTLKRLADFLTGGAPTGAVQRVKGLATQLEGELCAEIITSAREGTLVAEGAGDPRLLVLEAKTIHELAAQGNLAVKDLIDDFQTETLLGSITYTLNRVDSGSDYSQIKLIADGLLDFQGMQLVANSFISLNHSPSNALKQGTVRDYGAILSLTGKFDNLLTRHFPGNDTFSKIGWSFTGRYRRLEDINKGQGTVQTKFEVPITAGFSLPLSLSYTSRTETSSKDDFKIGIGVDFDTDKLMALMKLGSL